MERSKRSSKTPAKPPAKLLLFETLAGSALDPEEIIFRRRFEAQGPNRRRNYFNWDLKSKLNFLLEPLGTHEFCRGYLSKKYHHFQAADPNRFENLFGFERLKELIENNRIPQENLWILDKNSLRVPFSEYTTSGYFCLGKRLKLAPAKTLNLISNLRSSSVVKEIHKFDANLDDFAYQMAKWTGADVGINAYLTPAKGKTFGWHWDAHDVLILQIEGEKKWELYDSVVHFPIDGEISSARKWVEVNQRYRSRPCNEVILQAGDVLYVPAGMAHNVTALRKFNSMHLTISMNSGCWGDILRIAMDLSCQKILGQKLFCDMRKKGSISEIDPKKISNFVKAVNSEILSDKSLMKRAFDIFLTIK